jgi:aspartate/methionine/tyrosine aminotransferase
LGYTESQGDPQLREAIAQFYPSCGPEDVLVTNAPDEAIFLAMHTLLGEGDRVVVETPCYQSLLEVARSIGCEVVPWRLRETERGWKMDLDHLENLLAGETQLLVVNAPHNPTGHHPTVGEWQRILAMVEERDVRLFSDEMYRGLEPSTDMALAPAASTNSLALSLWGMSKTFGLPGLRIGWLVTRDEELLRKINRLKDYTTICSSAPGEYLTRMALAHANAFMERNRKLIDVNKAHMRQFAEHHGKLMKWREPMAGPVSLVRLSDGSASEFCDRAREQAGVLLVPSVVFDMDDHHVRVGLGRKNFAPGLDLLARMLEKT